ncbi:uncharacterized protein RHO25_002078 [Cercospora beticola]|nr:hypothetical protein RHO25_002078 [Cercospora beticola]
MGVAPSKEKVDGLIKQALHDDLQRRKLQYSVESDYAADEEYDYEYAQDYDDEAEYDVDDTSVQSIQRQPSLAVKARPQGTSVARQCLEDILPGSDDYSPKRKKKVGPLGWQIWQTEAERNDFITTALIVLSSNGQRPIANSKVHLFILRGGSHSKMWRAALAIMDDLPELGHFREDMLLHTFAARNFAPSKKEAFQQLVFDIEAMLDGHINDAETHISRFGHHLGRQQLKYQLDNRVVQTIEQGLTPDQADLGAALAGVELPPEIKPVYSSTIIPHKMKARQSIGPRYNGFMVDEVASKNLGPEQHRTGVLGGNYPPSMNTTGGVGAVPYGQWMQPVGESGNDHLRLRDIQQMHLNSARSRSVTARASMSSMNTIQTIPDGTPSASASRAVEGYFPTHLDHQPLHNLHQPAPYRPTRVPPLSPSGIYTAAMSSSSSVSPQSSTTPSPRNSTSSASSSNHNAAWKTGQLGSSSKTSLAHSTTSQIVEPACTPPPQHQHQSLAAIKRRQDVKFQLPGKPQPKSILKGSLANLRPSGRHAENRPLNDKSNLQEEGQNDQQLPYYGMEQLKPDEEHDKIF